ncbi:MAG: hypothetical protein M1816_000491 [Peltula sp. TS41687]|nr:MAG: hypothetical protein M1816_000491 [Peltula sp. TS41687]
MHPHPPARSLLLLFWSFCSVSSFQNTSPFFYYSTASTPSPAADIPQLIRSDILSQRLLDSLSSCSADTYIIAAQPAVHAADFLLPDAAPHLKRSMNLPDGDGDVKSSFSVADVLGELDIEEVEDFLHTKCNAEVMNVDAASQFWDFFLATLFTYVEEMGRVYVRYNIAGSFRTITDMKPRVVRVDFPALPRTDDSSKRAKQLRENDSILSSLLDLLPSTKYTVIYTTTPSHHSSHSSHGAAAAAELKRRDGATNQSDDNDDGNNNTLPDGPLFTRYQFLTPGLFMGLLVAFFLLAIMAVGLNALASLKVSYGAFEREMGPAGAAGAMMAGAGGRKHG